MSYDIAFWKPKPSAAPDPRATYERLNRNEHSDDLESLPLPEVISRLREAFPDFDPTDEAPAVRLQNGSMEIRYTAQSFRFDFLPPTATGRGRVWQVMIPFGCVAYDPQTGKVHDRNNPPDYADVQGDLAWLLDPGRFRETKKIEATLQGMYGRILRTVLPKVLVFLFVVSTVLAVIVTLFVYFIRWVVSLFAASV